MSVSRSIELALSLGDKLMDKLPDYDQRKREKYHKLKGKYRDELSKGDDKYDDSVVGGLRDELCDFLEAFHAEV